MTVVPHPPYFSLFKIKSKGCHFDTTEVNQAESLAVLNNLTEHIFQDAFKKMTEVLRTVHARGRGTNSRVMATSRPKVSFEQTLASVP
jgi:hypothetical protein